MNLSTIWLILLTVVVSSVHAEHPANFVAGDLITLDDNGAWSWFMDERAIVADGKLIVGSVSCVGNFRSGRDDPNWGNVELSIHDLAGGTTEHLVLHQHFEQDDHDGPALLRLPDGRILAVYTRHAVERKVFVSVSDPKLPLLWRSLPTIETPGEDAPPYSGSNVTYSNLFQLKSGRIYNFYRGFDYDPNFMSSDDDGKTWQLGGRLLKGLDGYGPYMKYAFDGDSTIHFVVTEDHPRNFDNSLYYGFVRDGEVYRSDGKPLGPLATGTDTQVNAWELTKIFQGDPDNVAWMTDVELDADKRPCVIFTVQKDGRGLERGKGGFDHRFYFARWNGTAWQSHEIAYAGTRLYPGEDDYTGLAAIDPKNVNVIYISTDADPVAGKPLISSADHKRHHELFRGETTDRGATWTWTPITTNSTTDNLRPIVPKWNSNRTALVWMRGTYRHNHGDWVTAVVATILPPGKSPAPQP